MMRFLLLVLFLVIACDKPTTASSWTVQVMSKGTPVASTVVKITFLDETPKPVGIAEGTTDANGNITVPVMLSGATAKQASIWIANRGIATVPFGAKTVEVPAAVP
jgi:hypothetical protein